MLDGRTPKPTTFYQPGKKFEHDEVLLSEPEHVTANWDRYVVSSRRCPTDYSFVGIGKDLQLGFQTTSMLATRGWRGDKQFNVHTHVVDLADATETGEDERRAPSTLLT